MGTAALRSSARAPAISTPVAPPPTTTIVGSGAPGTFWFAFSIAVSTRSRVAMAPARV